jgi:hypothetical protein
MNPGWEIKLYPALLEMWLRRVSPGGRVGRKEVMGSKETSVSKKDAWNTIDWKEREMRKVKNWWMVVLLGAVLMATLVGLAAARPNDTPAGAVTRRITIPPGHFIPCYDHTDWSNWGNYLESETDGSTEWMLAPVVFPTGQSVVVESMTLYAYDNNASDEICVYMFQVDVTARHRDSMASVCSSGASTTDPRQFTDSVIAYNPLKHGKGVYLGVDLQDDTNLFFCGVRIQYHHGTT